MDLADNSRPVPPFSLTATDPSDVYPLHGIIHETEWKSLPVSGLYEAGSAHNRKQILPFRGSDWVNTRLESIMQQTEKDKKRSLCVLSRDIQSFLIDVPQQNSILRFMYDGVPSLYGAQVYQGRSADQTGSRSRGGC